MPGFIKKNRKFLSILFLFILLFWLLTIQVKNGRFTFMERPVLAISGFFERIISWPFNTVVSIGKGYVLLVGTQQENQRLRTENDKMLLENAVMNELQLENERLRDALDFKRLYPPTDVMAQVIGKESSPASSTITLNKGADQGIRKDMAVITAHGVVGKVHAVLPGTSKVLLLTDPGCTIAVRVMRNREEGLLEAGDLLVTSGLDGVFPKGLAVARVVNVSKHEAIAFQTILAEPAVSFSRLEEALVLIK
jgi:rod shape-determining protein MreC